MADARVQTAARVGRALPGDGGVAMLEDPDSFHWALRVAMQRVVIKDDEAANKAQGARRREAVRRTRRRR